MAIISIGYDGSINEGQWADLAAYLGHSPCAAGPTSWKVSAVVGLDRTVRVAVGDGYGYGVLDSSSSTVDIQLAVSGSTRWDTIVARRDWTPTPGGGTTFEKVVGAGMVLAPGLLADPGVSADQPIALVQITAGQSTPTAVIDLRRLPDGSLASYAAREILGLGAVGPTPLGVAGGFTGLATCWSKAGTAWLRLLVSKSGANIANTTVQLCTVPPDSLPPGQWPGVLALGNTESVRVSIDDVTGIVTVPGLTISPGEILQGTLSWPIGA